MDRGTGPETPREEDAHLEHLETWFDSHADQWRDAYRRVQRVNDLVLAGRQAIAIEFIQEHVPPTSLVLDAGCGAGWASLELARTGYRIHGVDLAQQMIDQCGRMFSAEDISALQFEFTCADLLSVDLPPGSFDGIVALGVLQYQSDERELLDRFHALLRAGGVLVVTGPTARSIPNLFGIPAAAGSLLRMARLLPARPSAGKTQHRYSSRRFRRLLRAAAFDVIAEKGHGFGDWVVLGGLLGFRGELRLHLFLSRFGRLARFGNDLVVVARKPG